MIHPAHRCLLFVPGDSQAKLQKAFGLHPDAIVIDWEDAVLPAHKGDARNTTLPLLAGRTPTEQATIVRINPVDSAAFGPDCEALAGLPSEALPDGVMVAKCASSEDVSEAAAFLDEVDPSSRVGLYAVIESARGVVNVVSIVTASDRVAAVAFGAEDFSAETGIRRGPDDVELLYARSAVVTAARAAGCEVYDSPSMDFRDLAKVKATAERARNLGFSGQLAIHPGQIPIVQEAFRPTSEEIAGAGQVLRNFSEQGLGVMAMEGRLVDEPILKRARRTLRLAGVQDPSTSGAC